MPQEIIKRKVTPICRWHTIVTFSGSFVFREDVLRHIHIEQEEQRKANLPFWSAMKAFENEEWLTMRELRKWYVAQAYLFFRKELAVARKLGIDVRTVSTILRGEVEQMPDADKSINSTWMPTRSTSAVH